MNLTTSTLKPSQARGAAALFCKQFDRQRAASPALPGSYSQVDRVAPLVSELSERAQGVTAFSGSKLIGYLIGMHVPRFVGLQKGVYCPEWSHGATPENRTEIYQGMYEAMAEKWMSDGYRIHCITLMASDTEAIEAFFMMGFGVTTVDAIAESKVLTERPPAKARIERIGVDRVQDIIPLSKGLEAHLRGSPCFLSQPRRRWDAYYRRFLAGKGKAIWAAYVGGTAVSYIKCEPSTEPGACQVVRDSRVLKVSGAYTVPELRRSGLASALLTRALRESGKRYATCSVDFESANLTASRFWMRYFEPVCLSLVRQVGRQPGQSVT